MRPGERLPLAADPVRGVDGGRHERVSRGEEVIQPSVVERPLQLHAGLDRQSRVVGADRLGLDSHLEGGFSPE